MAITPTQVLVSLWALAALASLAWLSRAAARRLRVPPILGELLLGILLGAYVLGRLRPGVHAALFPDAAAPALEAAAWLGLVLFMFLIGAEIRVDPRDRPAAAWVALGGLVVPFTLGFALFLARPHWFTDDATNLRSGILVAVALTVTALPVLGRILHDAGLLDQPLAGIALGAATLDDLTAWLLLSLLAGAVHVGLTGHLGLNLLLVLAVFLAAYAVTRATSTRLAEKPTPAPLLLVAILAAAWFTEAAGFHAFLGPLLVGLSSHAWPAARDHATRVIRPLTLMVFLPVFFILAGAQVDPVRLARPEGLLALAVVLVVATLAKTLGCYIGARTAYVRHAPALALGVLMNARGAVGLIVAQVGLAAGLVHDTGYGLLVGVVFLTTLATPLAFRGALARAARGEPSAA